MKNLIKLIILLTLVATYSCETFESTYPDLTNSYPAYVELSNTNPVTVPEGGNINFTITSRTVIYSDYSVSYTITGDYEKSGTIEVPKGVNHFDVSVPVDAGIVTGDPLEATLTLTGVDSDLSLGRTDDNLSLDVTISKFVPFVQSDYAITFDCDEPGYMVYQVDFVSATDPHVLTNTNFWDYSMEVDYTFSGDFDQTITIEKQLSTDAGGDDHYVSGSGTYDGVTKTMVVDYLIVDMDGAVEDDNTHTFTVPAK